MQPPNIPSVPPGRYRHYKGKDYEVIGMALHSETLEPMVVYRPLYATPDIPEGTLWIRPAAMFLELVETESGQLQRFSKL